jgi:hypothetical protein
MNKKKINWKKVLEYIKIIADTIGSLAPVIKLLMIFGSSFAVAMYVNDITKKSKFDEFIRQNKIYEKEKQMAMLMADSNSQLAAKLQAEVAVLKLRNKDIADSVQRSINATLTAKKKAESYAVQLKDSTKTLTDSVAVLQELLPVKTVIIEQQSKTIALHEKRIYNDSLLILKTDTIIMGYETTTDSLQKIIAAQPKVPAHPEKLFGFIPMPSRRTAFITGALAGSIAVMGAMKK